MSVADVVSERAEPTELGDGVTRLGALVPLDDLSGWVPAGTRGLEPFNVYLVAEGGDCLVVNTGPAVIAPTVLAQLQALVPPRPLHVALTRNEFEVMGGLAAVLAAYPGSDVIYPGAGGILDWIDYRQAIAGVEHDLRREVPVVTAPFFGGVYLLGDRELSFPIPPLGTLSFAWIYDERSSTLFCSDAFSFVHVECGEPVVQHQLPARVTPFYVAGHLVKRFSWLVVADRGAIAGDLRDFFGTNRVTRLCPSRGCPISGASAVADALEVLLAAFDLLGEHGA